MAEDLATLAARHEEMAKLRAKGELDQAAMEPEGSPAQQSALTRASSHERAAAMAARLRAHLKPAGTSSPSSASGAPTA